MTDSRVFSRLYDFSDPFRRAWTSRPSYGLDEFSTNLPRQRHLYPPTRNTAHYDPIHQRRSDQGTQDTLHSTRQHFRHDPREPRHLSIHLGTFQKPPEPFRVQSSFYVFLKLLFLVTD